jgi:hypothetical protein
MSKSVILRVYPIRTTKKEWDIHIHCKHECNNRCSYVYTRDNSNPNINRFILMNNADYDQETKKCSMYNKLQRTFVRLSTFDQNNPHGGSGPLYNPNIIVIPDKKFSIIIDYPLSCSVEVIITEENPFTMRMLIHTVKLLYQYIYDEEEKTSTSRLYRLKKSCTSCENKNILDYIQPASLEKTWDLSECPICITNFTDTKNIGVLECGHAYHVDCISKWFENASTCPLCRDKVINCNICNGSKYIHHEFVGSVIPLEYRGSILNRNTTDGIFGIFGYDMEDLVIEHMHYNNVKKQLKISIGS